MAGFAYQHKPKIDILKEHPELAYIKDPVKRQHVMGFYERSHKADGFLGKYANILAIIAVPLIGFFYWLFYCRAQYNYSEHLISCMYMNGFGNLVYALVFIPLSMLFVNEKNPRAPGWIIATFLIAQITYNAIYYYHFMNRKSTGALLKSIGVSVFAIVFWTALTIGGVMWYIKYGG